MSTWPQVVKTVHLIRRLGVRPLSIEGIAQTLDVKERQAYRIIKMIQEDLGVQVDKDEFGGIVHYYIRGDYSKPIRVNVPSVALTPQERMVLAHLLRPSPTLEETSLWDVYALLMKRIGVEYEQNGSGDISRPGDSNFESTKKNATASLLAKNFAVPNPDETHWEAGTSTAVFRWDPISGTSDGGRTPQVGNDRYVIIRRKD